jgi:hypothetical protein
VTIDIKESWKIAVENFDDKSRLRAINRNKRQS